MSSLATIRAQAPSPETFTKVNKRMLNLPPEDAVQPETLDAIKTVKSKLTQDLNDIKTSAENEAK